MKILDSGTRRSFDSGAVRDVAEGKGRCDLLPLDIVSELLYQKGKDRPILQAISRYIRTGDLQNLQSAIQFFCANTGKDLITLMLDVAKHYEEGAKKYSERNWEKGIPLHCYIDSGVRHYLKFLRGDTDEPHDRAFVWNMLGAIWTHLHRPGCIDLPFAQEEKAQCK